LKFESQKKILTANQAGRGSLALKVPNELRLSLSKALILSRAFTASVRMVARNLGFAGKRRGIFRLTRWRSRSQNAAR